MTVKPTLAVLSIILVLLVRQAFGTVLQWPIECIPPASCDVGSGYPDVDGNGIAFDCGAPGYTGHEGTDISISWAQMDLGVDVYAAADGIVLWVFDGKYDRCPDLSQPDCRDDGATEPTYASSWVLDPSADWIENHGQTAGEYQQSFDSLSSAGYRAIWIDTTVIEGSARYASLWVRRNGPAWQGRHGQTSSEYQSTVDAMSSLGYRPLCVDAHDLGGNTYYASIWEEAPGTTWEARHGQPESEYQATVDAMIAQGFRPICVDTHVSAGVPYYASLWIDDGAQWEARHGLSETDHQSVFDDLSAQGFRMICIDAYPSSSGPRYASLWEADTQSWQGWHGQPESVHESTLQASGDAGYRPTSVSVHSTVMPGYRVCTDQGDYCGTGDCCCFWCFDGGNVVVIQHPDVPEVFATRYDHLKLNSILVNEGDIVVQGDKIAEVGSSGRSDGPHLHFEVWGAGFYDPTEPWAGPCGPNHLQPLWNQDPPWGNEPTCELSTAVLEFGVGYSGAPQTVEFSIANTGGGVLEGGISCTNTSYSFDPTNYSLSSGQSTTVSVTYQPTGCREPGPGEEFAVDTIDVGVACGSIESRVHDDWYYSLEVPNDTIHFHADSIGSSDTFEMVMMNFGCGDPCFYLLLGQQEFTCVEGGGCPGHGENPFHLVYSPLDAGNDTIQLYLHDFISTSGGLPPSQLPVLIGHGPASGPEPPCATSIDAAQDYGPSCDPSENPCIDEQVVLEGVVYVVKDYSNGGHYMQGDTGGINFYDPDMIPLSPGDHIRIEGPLWYDSNAEIYVGWPDVTILGHQDPPTPAVLPTGSLQDCELIGNYIETRGTVTDIGINESGFDFYRLDDGSGPVMVYIDPDTGADLLGVDLGEQRWVRSPAMLFSGEVRLSPMSASHHSDNAPTGTADGGVTRPIMLHGISPNPFNPSTTIRFEVAKNAIVDLDLIDVSGQLIRRLADRERFDGGIHERFWDGKDDSGAHVAAGIYLCRARSGAHQESMRMVLLK